MLKYYFKGGHKYLEHLLNCIYYNNSFMYDPELIDIALYSFSTKNPTLLRKETFKLMLDLL